MKLFLCLLFSAVCVASSGLKAIPNYLLKTEGKLWAVLVAGSSGWDNYRHQSDICHSYQILKNHGIPDERIIVLMVDDLANNSANPTPGVLINHPKGKDVYKGVPHDYTGLDGVTPENFMAVLRGDRSALNGVGSGKVLESGPQDHVFVYFSDHGAPGLIAFPETELTAKQLNKTIDYMYKNKKYGKMVVYIEACESGSMFENILPSNKNVYATTAANGEESSYACYFDDDRETYLGDLYSVNWMEDSDKEVLTKETLQKQFKIVKKETNDSHVQEFGDMNIGKMKVSEFQGRKNAKPIYVPQVMHDAVPSRDVPIEIAKRKYLKANSEAKQTLLLAKLNKMLSNRLFLSDKVREIVGHVFPDAATQKRVLEEKLPLRDLDCYDRIRTHFNDECFNLSQNPYSLQYMYVLVNLCEKSVPPSRYIRAMDVVCRHPPVHGIV